MKEAGDAGIVTRDRSGEQVLFAFMQSIAGQQAARWLALDVGACDGQSSLPYAQAKWKVISLDIVMLDLHLGLRAGWIQPGRAVVADERYLPFRDATFDLASSRWFLHEFPGQPAFPYMKEPCPHSRDLIRKLEHDSVDHVRYDVDEDPVRLEEMLALNGGPCRPSCSQTGASRSASTASERCRGAGRGPAGGRCES